MKARDLRKLNDQELRERLTQGYRRLLDLRTQAETEKLEKPSDVTKAKREIARIFTLFRERGVGVER